MLCYRIIPCLDCDLAFPNGRVVKGIEFQKIRYAGIPWQLAEKYYIEGADEIVFLDITASHERRGTMIEVIKKTSESVFVPLTVGGGISTIEDARKVFKSGADKISINTAAIKNPVFINKFTKYFGSQACVIAIDAKRRPISQNDKMKNKIIIDSPQGSFWYECSIYGGRKFTGIDAIQWAMEAESRGAGEILLTSMDKDGTEDGYDTSLTKTMCEKTDIPIIASGGCGKPEHIYEIFKKSNASAALAASIFHYDTYGINRVKKYLVKKGLKIRLEHKD